MKLKEKLKQWLFKDELEQFKEIDKLKNDYIWLKSITENSIAILNNSSNKLTEAKSLHEGSKILLDDTRKLLTEVCDIGVDVHTLHPEYNWAVVCMHGKIDYVKFIPLNNSDARDVMNFLKRFEYSNKYIDSFVPSKKMLEDYIVNWKY